MDREQIIIIIIIIIALLGGVLIAATLFAVSWVRKQAAKQKNALERLAGPLADLAPGKKLSAAHDGVEFEADYYAGSRNAPPRLTVSVSCNSNGAFKITRESGFDRFFKRHGITREAQTLEQKFDDDYFIHSENMDFVARFFQTSDKRDAIDEIFALGYNSVEHDGKVMNATCSPFRPNEDLPPTFVTGAVSQLDVLASDLPSLPETPVTLDTSPWKAKRFIAFAVPIFGLLAGLLFLLLGLIWYPPLDGFDVFLDSSKYSLPLLVVFLWIAVKLVRGRSSSHYELIAICFLSLAAFPLTGMGLETFLNGWLDDSPSSSHDVSVLDKYISRSGKNTDYNLVLESWRPNRRTEKLEVSSGNYHRAKINETKVHLVTKPGRFGFEWRLSYRLTE
jgi:hypothetical protein